MNTTGEMDDGDASRGRGYAKRVSVQGNPRYLLRAFETADAARTAWLLVLQLRDTPVTRSAVAEAWADRYPRHVAMTGQRSIRGRISRGLTMLRAVNAVTTVNDTDIGVGDSDLLQMAADNLAAIEGEFGEALPPSMWRWRPDVPDYLRDIQAKVWEAM